MTSPETIFFSSKTKIGKNVSIEPYVVFIGNVILKNNIIIKSFSHLEDVKVENNVSIGPYARLRPGTILSQGVKIGNFVEVKKTIILLSEHLKIVVEPGGAVAVAAALTGQIPSGSNTIVAVASGGNIDKAMFHRALDAGAFF